MPFKTMEEERDELRECLKREVALTCRLIRERDEARARLNDLLGFCASDEECEHDMGPVFCWKCGEENPKPETPRRTRTVQEARNEDEIEDDEP